MKNPINSLYQNLSIHKKCSININFISFVQQLHRLASDDQTRNGKISIFFFMLSSLVSMLLLFDDQGNVQLRKTEQILELSSTIFFTHFNN